MKRSILRLVQATLFYTILSFSFPSPAPAQPIIGFSSFITGLASPVDIVNAGDGSNRLFIVQQRGVIRVYDLNTSTLLPTPFLDITPLLPTGSEQGLLSMAFYPNYEHPDSAYFFIYYTNLAGSIVLARYQPTTPTANTANPAGVILLTIPKTATNHNGGKLNFGPENYLYFATGDGGGSNDPDQNAQNRNSLLGKMLRIDVKDFSIAGYNIPPDNPYALPGGFRDEIWSWGLRNPWRWSFDRLTHGMFIADVGQGAYEEINYNPHGSTGSNNYGWRCFEGLHPNTAVGPCTPSTLPVTDPVYEYTHNPTTGGFSVAGGHMYRGTNPVNAPLVGYYIFSDTYRPNTWLMNTNVVGFPTTRQAGLQNGISGYGEDESGELYVASLFSNTVYRVVVTGVLPVTLLSFNGSKQGGYNELKWITSDEQNISRYIIEYGLDGISWTSAGQTTALNQAANQQYSFRHFTTETAKLFYRLRIEDNRGQINYSPIISINGKAGLIRVFPTIIKNNLLQITAEHSVTRIELMDNSGHLVFSKQTGGQQGYFGISLPELNAGLYWVKLYSPSGPTITKVIIE